MVVLGEGVVSDERGTPVLTHGQVESWVGAMRENGAESGSHCFAQSPRVPCKAYDLHRFDSENGPKTREWGQ